MQVIQHQELGSAQSSIVFSSIPQTYTDLLLVLSEKNASANDVAVFLQFNSSTTGYTIRRLLGTGSGSGINQSFGERQLGFSSNANFTASTFSSTLAYFPNYTSSAQKSWSVDTITENNAGNAYAGILGGIWTGTDPITSLTLSPNGGSFVQYSSATLYGILKGSNGVVVS